MHITKQKNKSNHSIFHLTAKREKLSSKYHDRMDEFVRRMIKRPNVMNEYKNSNDHSFKDDMHKNLVMSIIQYNDNTQPGGSIDVSSY